MLVGTPVVKNGKTKNRNQFVVNQLRLCEVFPWGVEPQSMEPESIILSIELREQILLFSCAKVQKFL